MTIHTYIQRRGKTSSGFLLLIKEKPWRERELQNRFERVAFMYVWHHVYSLHANISGSPQLGEGMGWVCQMRRGVEGEAGMDSHWIVAIEVVNGNLSCWFLSMDANYMPKNRAWDLFFSSYSHYKIRSKMLYRACYRVSKKTLQFCTAIGPHAESFFNNGWMSLFYCTVHL